MSQWQIKHIQPISAPLLIFGGPYSNFQALSAMRRVAEELNIPSERVICTGDTVAYCADPQAVVDAIRDWDIHVIKGNCEQAIAENSNNCGCGFEADSVCDVYAKTWFEYTKAAVDQEARQWMDSLPDQIAFQFNGLQTRVVHATCTSNNDFVFPSVSNSVLIKEFESNHLDMIIAGHSGLPFTRQVTTERHRFLWHNAGVIGMPANDGCTNTWYSVLLPMQCKGGIEIKHEPLIYDYHLASQRVIEQQSCEPYAETLVNGLWPSMDVLTPDERRQVGVEIKPNHLIF